MKREVFFCIFLMHIYSSIAQQTEGLITLNNKPLDGVNVLNKTSFIGTTSDLNGEFSLNTSIGDTLIFSYVGLKTLSIKVINYDQLTVEMEPDVNTLDETIVVGKKNPQSYELEKPEKFNNIFGEHNLKNAGYSVDHLRSEEVQNYEGQDRGKIPAIVFAIQGKVASYRIGPSGVVLRSRSLTQGNYALWEIDGQIFEGFPPPIDLQTIEDVFVIKSLAGTNLYGSRGAGGVIVVNTKNQGGSRKNSDVINNTAIGEKGIPYASLKNENGFENLETDQSIREAARAMGEDINRLRGLAFYCQSIGKPKIAAQIYRFIMSVSKDKIQSLRDLAETWSIINKPIDAWNTYLTALELNDQESDSNIGKLIYHEMERLYSTDQLKGIGKGRFQTQSDFSDASDKTYRIVFEWSSENHDLSIEIINPNRQLYATNFGPIHQTNQRVQEFFLDNTIKGIWSFNISGQDKNQENLYVKVVIYRNWYTKIKSAPKIHYFKFPHGSDRAYHLFDIKVF